MIEVLACPAPTSVQDLGRHGYRHFGVPLSGALDPESLRLTNALVGNPPTAAALEFRLVGPCIRVLAPTRIALASAGARITHPDGLAESLPPWRAITLSPGAVLAIGRPLGTGYLAFSGGIDTPMMLGSRSIYERAGFGRRLEPGMLLPLGPADLTRPELAMTTEPRFADSDPIRVMPGPQRAAFTDASFSRFIAARYTVGTAADRMGLRLEGPALTHIGSADIASEAVTPGAIQVPGDGQPIILLADCQTIGGYAKIATVITADLPRLGRLLPGHSVRFSIVDAAAALIALQARTDWLTKTIATLRPWGREYVDLDALYQCNLVDGVIHAD